MSINGKNYDWEDISVTLPHGVAAEITEIKYSDEMPITAHYGRGVVPRSYGRGNYKATGSFSLDRDEWEKLSAAISQSGQGIYSHKPFTIVVSYAGSDKPEITDTLKSCKITKHDGGGGAQGDDKVSAISCDFEILEPIEWNGKPAIVGNM